MEAIACVTVRDTLTDCEGRTHDVSLSCFIVSCLSRHRFSVEVSTKYGIVTIFDENYPLLEAGMFMPPAEQLVHDQHLNKFCMNLSDSADQ